jgi:hypothetical protein
MANMRILSLHIATIYILGVFGEDSTLNPGFDVVVVPHYHVVMMDIMIHHSPSKQILQV